MSMMSDIAGLSVSMHAAELQQSVSISIAKKSMDSAELAAQELLQMLPPQPGVGEHINTSASKKWEVRRRTSHFFDAEVLICSPTPGWGGSICKSSCAASSAESIDFLAIEIDTLCCSSAACMETERPAISLIILICDYLLFNRGINAGKHAEMRAFLLVYRI